MPKRIAVLVSGGGTNLQALIDAQARGEIVNGEIVLVISSTPRRASPAVWWPGRSTPPTRP